MWSAARECVCVDFSDQTLPQPALQTRASRTIYFSRVLDASAEPGLPGDPWRNLDTLILLPLLTP